jgi:hypothetical protein
MVIDSNEEHGSQVGEASVASGDAGWYWRRRAEQAEVNIRRLSERLNGKDRQIAAMEKAIARTVALHHAVEERLEQELESLHTMSPGWGMQGNVDNDASPEQTVGVVVRLPYVTGTLTVLFDVMRIFWSDWDPERPPKSSTVAHAIDKRLNLKGQSSGEASRSAQTFAAAIRPDSVSEADGRHR